MEDIIDEDLQIDLLLVDTVSTLKRMKEVKRNLDNNLYKPEDREPVSKYYKGLHAHAMLNMMDVEERMRKRN